ncbi:monocarboxylate transporter 12-like [Acanthaster planci]|uniref:Monocarboxylate transporter 12-like n=1 Tax=Acanthaster planci TaxID=133434 RepID=A0A8B7YC84_ACAPL|nr:monocarboxylate transporter 12-like [Acanthaster planci]
MAEPLYNDAPLQTKTLKRAEPPVAQDGGWAWLVLAGTFLSQALMFGYYGSVAVYVPVWIDFFDSSATESSLIVSLSSFFMGLLSVVAGILITRFSVRTVWMIGGVLASLGLLISALATSTLFLTLSMSLITALGFSICMNCGFVALSMYFKKRLTVAVGLASSGFAAGQVALTPLLDYLIDQYGWRGSMVITAGILLHATACGALVRPLSSKAGKQASKVRLNSKTKSADNGVEAQSKATGDYAETTTFEDSVRVCFDDKGILWQKNDDTNLKITSEPKTSVSVSDDSSVPGKIPRDPYSIESSGSTISLETKKQIATPSRSVSNPRSVSTLRLYLSRFWTFMMERYGLSRLFRNPSFVLTIPVGIAHGFGWASVVFHLDARAESVGLQSSEGATLLTLMGVGAFVGSISHGWFVDKGYISPVIAYILAILGNAVTSFILPPLVTFGPLAATCVFFGFSTGVAEPVIFVVLQVLVQPSEVAGATSLFLVCWGTGEIVGATIAGWIYDTLASYNNAYFMSGSVFTLAATLAIMIYFLEKRKSRGQNREADEATIEAERAPQNPGKKSGDRLDVNPESGVVNPVYLGDSNNDNARRYISPAENSARGQDQRLSQEDDNESSC